MAEFNIAENMSDDSSNEQSRRPGSVEESSRSGRYDFRLADDEIKEMDLEADTDKTKKQKLGVRPAVCEFRKECVLSVGRKIALFLCYICNLYICEDCLKKHDKTHEFVRVESEESERRRMSHLLVGRMRIERMRELNFNEEDVKVYARVNVKHGLDKKDCRISGLCGLQDKRWVVLDSRNNCMKIFSSVTNTLLRYVRFGSQPRDATEIKQKSTDPNSASGSKSGVSGAARDEQDKQCLLAVTFYRIKQIWFIDVNKTQQIKTKSIQMEKECWEIEFSEDKIFTLCREDVGSEYRYSIDILSAEGNPLKVIQLDFEPYNLAVCKDGIYLTELSDKVFCINVEDGKTISQLDIGEGSGLEGICLDHSNNVYICTRFTNKLYRLSSDLHGYEPLSLDTEYIEYPDKICFTDNKLIVGHWYSSQSDFVTVVQIT